MRRHRASSMRVALAACAFALVACALALVAGDALAAAAERCVAGRAGSVTLRGVVERRTYPGPPRFESVALGDRPETALYLVLADPVCIAEAPAGKSSLVHLDVEGEKYMALKSRQGTAVTVRGKLFAGEARQHHAPLVLRDVIVPR